MNAVKDARRKSYTCWWEYIVQSVWKSDGGSTKPKIELSYNPVTQLIAMHLEGPKSKCNRNTYTSHLLKHFPWQIIYKLTYIPLIRIIIKEKLYKFYNLYLHCFILYFPYMSYISMYINKVENYMGMEIIILSKISKNQRQISWVLFYSHCIFKCPCIYVHERKRESRLCKGRI